MQHCNCQKSHFAFYVGILLIFSIAIIAFSTHAPNMDDIAYYDYINNLHWNDDGTALKFSGRFAPLSFLDLNILMYINKSPIFFMGYNAIILFLCGILCYKIFNILNLKNHFLFFIALLNAGAATIFLGICYHEKLIFLLLFLFLYCALIFLKRNSLLYASYAIILANYLIYTKESMFVLFFIIGLGLFILYSDKITRQFALALILSAAIFLIIYCILMLPIQYPYRFMIPLVFDNFWDKLQFGLNKICILILEQLALFAMISILIYHKIKLFLSKIGGVLASLR